MCEGRHLRLAKVGTDDLQAHWETALREPAGDGDRRQPEDVELPGVFQLGVQHLFRFLPFDGGFHRARRLPSRRHHEEIHVLEDIVHGTPKQLDLPPALNIRGSLGVRLTLQAPARGDLIELGRFFEILLVIRVGFTGKGCAFCAGQRDFSRALRQFRQLHEGIFHSFLNVFIE
jgi:hypothetical protein